jgi:hypothetical protein
VKQIRKRLTYANVMSSIAVFLVLGGATAFAASKIGAGQLKANSIKTGKIVKEAVTAGKIKNSAVTTGKVANGAINGGKLANGAVSTDKIADLAVTNGKLANEAVNNAKLANGAVTGGKIASGAVSRSNLSEAKFLPRAYAYVESDGAVDPALSAGMPDATNPSTGVYCFSLPFTPVHAQATGASDTEANDVASVDVEGSESNLENCATGNVEVAMWDIGSDAFTSEDFFLVVW